MSKNQSDLTDQDALVRRIKDLERQLRELKTNQLTNLVAPHFTTDPSSPIDGEIWYNETTNKVRKRENGVSSDI